MSRGVAFISRICQIQRIQSGACRWLSTQDTDESRTGVPYTSKIDRSRVPQLDERDLEEDFVSGSGPGGQSVNKSVNCCQLKHKPTGLRVKVHHTRSLESNRKIARELLVAKLDNLLNGENSVENQKKRIGLHKVALRKIGREHRRRWKEEWRLSMNASLCQRDDERT